MKSLLNLLIGYDTAQSSPDGHGFIGRAGPQSSNELHGVHASRPESSVSLQSGLDHYENSEDASSATSPNEVMAQSNVHSGYRPDKIPGVPSASSVQKSDDSDHRHPFELLLRDSQNSNHVEGVSFPTVKDLKHFVEILKSSYLIPGGDLTKHFPTAREMIAKEVRAQHARAESDAAQRAAAAAESASVYGGSENEGYSEPPEIALSEQMAQGGKYQTESKSSSVSDRMDSTPNQISTSLPDKQDLGQHLSSYPIPRSAARRLNFGAHEGFDNSLFSGNKPIFTNGPNIREEDEEDVQSVKLSRDISADARAKPFNSYARSIKVSAPKTLFNISDYFQPRPKDRPTPSYKRHQPSNDKKSKDVNETPTGHLRVSDSAVSSKSNPSPRRRTSQVATQSSRPHNSHNEVLNRKQPVGSHYTSNVKHTSDRDGYVGEFPPQNPNSTNQEPRVHNYLTPNSAGQHSARAQTYFPIMGDEANFNTLPNFPSPASSQTAFSRLLGNMVMSRRFGFESTNPSRSPTRGTDTTRNMLVSFLNQQSRGPFLNRASVGSFHAGILQNFMKRSKLWNHPHSVSQRFGNMVYQSPSLWSASKFFNYPTSGGILPNGGKNRPLFPWRGHQTSASPENLNSVKSRSDSGSGGDPRLLWQGRTGVSRWKPVLRPRRAPTQTP